MIGGPGPTPNLLRQYELGMMPKEMADEEAHEPRNAHHEERTLKRKRSRRRWFRLWRRS